MKGPVVISIRTILGLLGIAWLGGNAKASVLINELMYHPPGDSDALQYIELHNSGSSSVDVSGWRLDKGVKFTFPESSQIKAGGLVVLAKDSDAFQLQYRGSLAPLGEFSGRLSHSGERVRLVNRGGEVVDEVTYSDRAPWPRAADGYGASLERIAANGNAGFGNWAGSTLPRRKQARGTPGQRNDASQSGVPPVVASVTVEPRWPKPGESIEVSATLKTDGSELSANLYFWNASSRGEREPDVVAMTISDSTAKATLPSDLDQGLVRFYVEVTDEAGRVRRFPDANEPRPALTVYVGERPNVDKIPVGKVINVERPESGVGRFHRGRGGMGDAEPAWGNAAYIQYHPDGPEKDALFDYVRITRRRGGFKIRFHADARLGDVSVLNVLNEGDPRYLLSEYLSFELFRRAGVPAPLSGHLRLEMDGRLVGPVLTVEQVNRSFLRRNERGASGNLYKILWYANGVVEQHEKKTNRHEGHEDVVRAVGGLRRLRGADQWRFIQQHFDVANFSSYYAVNMCISNWDGFFNNYFTFHDTDGSGKWEIYPWDEDKTWGDFDGGPQDYAWYDFPLTSGMNGDRSPVMGRGMFRRGPFGGISWWRPPGFFSGPLLANQPFRAAFLARLKELCHTAFTEPQFLPVIDELEKRLLPEMILVGGGRAGNGNYAVQQLKSNIDSFRRQLKHRRTYILKSLAQ